MRLRRLIVKNTGIFKNTYSLDFDNELTVIYGPNLSGKTTLSRAIYFAICGKTLITGTKPKDMVSEGEKDCVASIVYSSDGQKYLTQRWNNGAVKTDISRDQTWHGIDHSALPPLNSLQWQVGCFLKEEELGEFLTLTHTSRRDLLNQLLGMEDLMRVQERFIEVRRIAKREEKRALAHQDSISENSPEDHSFELAQQKFKVESLQKRIAELDKPGDVRRIHAELQDVKQGLLNRRSALSKEFDEVKAMFCDVAELKETLDEVSQRLSMRKEYYKEMEALREKQITASDQLKQADEMLSLLDRFKGKEVCPICGQSIVPELAEKLRDHYHKQNQELSAELICIETQGSDILETLQLFDELVLRENDLRSRMEQLLFLKKEIEDTDRQIIDLENKLAPYDNDPDIEDIRNLKDVLLQNKTALEELEIQNALFLKYNQEKQNSYERAQKMTHFRLVSELMADAVEKTIQSTIGISLRKAEKGVVECLQRFGLFETGDGSIDLEKTQLLPDIKGRTFQNLSGSEKSILYLAMKVEISRLLPGSEILVLDNPTIYFDKTRRKYLCDYLLSLIPEKQIILFTNDHDFSEQFNQGKRIDL